jgi:hypothetical protein
MKNPIFCYKVSVAYEELKRIPDLETLSGGGPIIKAECADGIQELENTRYINCFHE